MCDASRIDAEVLLLGAQRRAERHGAVVDEHAAGLDARS
jgi:hypothetical protein